MEKTENLIMQEDRWKPLKEMNLTDDFLFDVATAELENCKTIIELSTGLRLKSVKWKEGQKVIYSKYAGTEVKLGDDEYIIVKQSDILAVVSE